MNRFFALMLVASILIPTSSFRTTYIGKNQSPTKTKIEVVFNSQLSFDNLVKIKRQLSKKGILLDYKMVLFDQNGNLKSIDFFVDFKDGFSGGASQDNLTNQSHFGFYRDYSKQATSPFGTGMLD